MDTLIILLALLRLECEEHTLEQIRSLISRMGTPWSNRIRKEKSKETVYRIWTLCPECCSLT